MLNSQTFKSINSYQSHIQRKQKMSFIQIPRILKRKSKVSTILNAHSKNARMGNWWAITINYDSTWKISINDNFVTSVLNRRPVFWLNNRCIQITNTVNIYNMVIMTKMAISSLNIPIANIAKRTFMTKTNSNTTWTSLT